MEEWKMQWWKRRTMRRYKFHPKGRQRMAADPQGTPHSDALRDTSTSVQGMKGPPATVDRPQEGEGPTRARRLVQITRR